MNTPLLSDIKVLDNLLALNLTISLWSARKKMCLEDFGGAELPPEDLASLGSKRIADPNTLKIFSTLKARAFNYLDRHGIRFMSGWAIPEDKAGEVVQELMLIREDFLREKEQFLNDYDISIQHWIDRHSVWGNIIRESTVGPDYVRSRMSFSWQLYKVAPLMKYPDMQAVTESGLHAEVEGLAQTLFGEIAKSANETWQKVYAGKTEVTHNALSPLRTLQHKLMGLTFIEPHVAPVVEILQKVFERIPAKGTIAGTDLVMLQGVVCLLRDPDALIVHAQKLIEGYGPATILDAVVRMPEPTLTPEDNTLQEAMPIFPDLLPPAHANMPNIGLW